MKSLALIRISEEQISFSFPYFLNPGHLKPKWNNIWSQLSIAARNSLTVANAPLSVCPLKSDSMPWMSSSRIRILIFARHMGELESKQCLIPGKLSSNVLRERVERKWLLLCLPSKHSSLCQMQFTVRRMTISFIPYEYKPYSDWNGHEWITFPRSC